MTDTGATDIAPYWVWGLTGVSAAVAVVSHFLGGSTTELFTGGAVALAIVGTVYLLYGWGQHRERPSMGADEDESSERERERQMMAEAGGYGGNGGGT